MAELAPYLLGAIASVTVGVFVFIASRARDKDDSRAKLFDDALDLASAHKEAWEKASCEIEELRQEISQLRDEIEDLRGSVKSAIREGEMWRGVAVAVAVEHKRKTGMVPLAWPAGEPFPATN